MKKKQIGVFLISIATLMAVTNTISKTLWKSGIGKSLPIFLMERGFSSTTSLLIAFIVSMMTLAMFIVGFWLIKSSEKQTDLDEGISKE